jgi:transposase
LVRKPEGKRPLGRPRQRKIHNIKMNITRIVRDGTDWIDLIQDRDKWRAVVNARINLPVL